MGYYERAVSLKQEIIDNRRYFHTNAEVGLDMPKAKAYVMQKLREYGLEPQECGYGVTATLGSGDKCILLRADMDALPMAEESGESFACPTGKETHACGHDLHAAMLLAAAKMLKEQEATLKGKIKFKEFTEAGEYRFPVSKSGNYKAVAVTYDINGNSIGTFETEFSYIMEGENDTDRSLLAFPSKEGNRGNTMLQIRKAEDAEFIFK